MNLTGLSSGFLICKICCLPLPLVESLPGLPLLTSGEPSFLMTCFSTRHQVTLEAFFSHSVVASHQYSLRADIYVLFFYVDELAGVDMRVDIEIDSG